MNIINLKKIIFAIVLTVAIYTLSGCSAINQNNEASSSYIETPIQYEQDESTLFEAQNKIKTNEWGLGEDLGIYITNDRDYNWYVDQYATGKHNKNNCGPTVAEMAIRWATNNKTIKASNLRAQCKPNGEWWTTEDVAKYLHESKIKTTTVEIQNKTTLENAIKRGHIIILCVDMNEVEYAGKTSRRVGKFYKTNKEYGHFIIVKGLCEVDGKTYLEIYDPNSWKKIYSDGSYKGKNRYIDSSEITYAAQTWWNNAILIKAL